VSVLPDGFDVAAETGNALDAMEANERLKALMACLDRLDAEKREAVLLAYYRGCSREALSRRFGRPVPTIKTWLHRSLTQLRLCLTQ
jgi:RNA polymerase sigma-70 factor (ECF subfamily)